MDFGWAELLIIGVVALIVIGPKDLPEMFRTLGRFTAKARSMARDFTRAMEQAAKESGVDEVAKDLKTVTSPKSMGLDAVKSAADKFEKWDPLKNAAKPTSPPAARPLTPPPMPPTPPVTAAAAAETVAEPRIMGPATTALAEQQAQRKAIAAEAAEKLRSVGAGSAPAAAVTAPPPATKPPRKPAKTDAAPKARSAAAKAAPPPASKPAAKAEGRTETATTSKAKATKARTAVAKTAGE